MEFGDLLLVKGRLDPIGCLIRKYTQSNYNHVAWIISDTEMIELRGRGILIDNPKRYFNKFLYKIKLLRIKDINLRDLYDAVSYATCLETKGNYFKLWITYFMILIKSKRKYPKLTCSAFIAKCLEMVGFNFNKTKKWYRITPSDIEKSKKTYVVNIDNNQK